MSAALGDMQAGSSTAAEVRAEPPPRADAKGWYDWQPRRATIRWAVGILLAVQAVLLAWAAYRDSPTWDEAAHFTAGVNVWRTGSFRVFCVNPPLVRTVGCGLV